MDVCSTQQEVFNMIKVNSDRLWGRIGTLSRITDPDKPWTRRAFDPQFAKGRAWLADEFTSAGLEVRIDAGGNLVGRLPGTHGNARALVTGSHSDTVPSGGRFDGMLGLLAALEVVQSMQEQQLNLTHPLEVVDFLAEEPSDFGLSCIGSRSWAGVLTEADLARTLPPDLTLAAAIDRAGGDTTRLQEPIRHPGSIAAYVELHIEQGLVLTNNKADIGVVTAIVGIRRYSVTVSGQADHAGTTPMELRKDALTGAAEFIGAVEGLARKRGLGQPYLVATVGRISVEPNAINAVPGLVNMILEIRSTHEGALNQFEWELQFRVEGELRNRGLRYAISELSRTAPTTCSALIQGAIEKAAAAAECTSMRLPSGAGHDGVYVARLAPMGMIFIPCRDGRSHAPEEWAEPHDCAQGARVLAETLLLLDRTLA
jgi:beta-ureidopropionase / N-carbamoyl-L-amino-acid hydrolase